MLAVQNETNCWGCMTVQLLCGDCRDVMALCMGEGEVDSIVTDPPYHLTNGKKGGSGEASVNLDSPYGRARVTTGFMGKQWDGGDVAMQPATWREALRVLKPGGYLLAFGGTRTFHRLACAIEDAGFELRDTIMWVYGSGFPKSHNGEWGGTALKPAWEPIVLARKPLIGTVEANWREHGTGALNIDGCRVPGETPSAAMREAARRTGKTPGRPGEYRDTIEDRTTPERYMQERAGEALGRWPANIIHDGSDEVLAAFPQAVGQIADASSSSSDSRKTQNVYGAMRRGRGDEPSADSNNEGDVGFKMKPGARRLDAGSAARFFYCAKASKSDRGEGNTHPTVKPTELMRYLCRLVTPAGGVILDPFMGSGSTGKAARLEGFGFVGIDLDPDHLAIAQRRIDA